MSRADRDELLGLAGVTCGYAREAVLVDVDLAIAEREFVGIVGPSGAGKTTALRVIAGSMRAAGGTVTRRPGLRMAYVPQVETINWSFPVTVRECVLMARASGRLLPWAGRAEHKQVDEVLGRLGIDTTATLFGAVFIVTGATGRRRAAQIALPASEPRTAGP